MTDQSSDPGHTARLLADLVDTLIPGDGGRWPSASDVGVQGILATRLVELRGEGGIAEVASALGDLRPGAGATERAAVVARFEAAQPALFALVRNAAFLAYYESPVVAAAIRALGMPYELLPHPVGYPLPPFDPARDAPRHGRGGWIATDAVRRVDLSGLDFLKAEEAGHGR